MVRRLSGPLVSAIIIFLNEECFLQEAIDSVLAQTYDNWELLLVDDGSTDAGAAIARRYADMYPEKIRYLAHEDRRNLGMSASRNLGIRNTAGKYISFLDGDDVWLPHKLTEQVAILESCPEAAVVCGPLLEWHSWAARRDIEGSHDRMYGVGPNGVHPFSGKMVAPPELLSLFLRNEVFIPAAAMVRRDAIERVGGAEVEFRGSYEDAVVFAKLCRTENVIVSGSCWYKYRIHPNSCERRAARLGQDKMNRLKYLDWIEKYFLRQNYTDKTVWRELRRSLFLARHPALQLYWDTGYAVYPLKLLARGILSEGMYERVHATVERFKKKAASTRTFQRREIVPHDKNEG